MYRIIQNMLILRAPAFIYQLKGCDNMFIKPLFYVKLVCSFPILNLHFEELRSNRRNASVLTKRIQFLTMHGLNLDSRVHVAC